MDEAVEYFEQVRYSHFTLSVVVVSSQHLISLLYNSLENRSHIIIYIYIYIY